MTRLRKMMLEELQRRNYSAITTRKYLQVVTDFAKYFGKSPDQLGPSHLRTYQAYLLHERKLASGTAVNCVAALRFFFVKTLKRYQFRDFLPYPRDRRRLPTILSLEEVTRLINAAGTLYRRALLMTLYATGMRRSELVRPHLNPYSPAWLIPRFKPPLHPLRDWQPTCQTRPQALRAKPPDTSSLAEMPFNLHTRPPQAPAASF